jgi:hypothetical protein
MISNSSFDVSPRYSPGSPALVDRLTAEKVMRTEREFYAHALEGIYGEAAQQKAQSLGLEGIVVERWESHTHVHTLDLMTDARASRSLLEPPARRCARLPRPEKLDASAIAADEALFPCVNLNGDARSALVTERRLAWQSLGDSITALINMAPHPRNYQTAPAGAYPAARLKHEERVKVLVSLRLAILAELNWLIENDPKRTVSA